MVAVFKIFLGEDRDHPSFGRLNDRNALTHNHFMRKILLITQKQEKILTEKGSFELALKTQKSSSGSAMHLQSTCCYTVKVDNEVILPYPNNSIKAPRKMRLQA